MNTGKMLVMSLATAVAVAAPTFSARATTYTWTNNTVTVRDWADTANWTNNTVYVDGSGNELYFNPYFLTPNVGGTQTITNVPATLSMNTLTLGGRGPNGDQVNYMVIGDNTSTWTIGDGTTATINLISIKGGGHAGTDDIGYTIAPNITLNQPLATFTGNGVSVPGYNFAGNITEASAGYSITKSGSSWLIFSGNNSYSGATTVNGGVLRLASANALPGGIGATGGTGALTLNGGVVEMASGDFLRNLGAGSDQFQITGGTSGFSAYGGARNVIINSDASQELVWGSTDFNPTTLVLNEASARSLLNFRNKIDLAGSTRTVNVNANVTVISGDIRTSSGTAGLTKNGAGTLVLTGNNTYNGPTTIGAGTLSVGAANDLGDSLANLVFNGGGLRITGTSLTSLSGIGHSVVFTATKAVAFDIVDAANTFTVDQVLNQGTGTLTKNGAGTLVLNQDNTFTGATTATGGGTLVLDYSTNTGRKLSNTPAALTLNGSALVLKGGSYPEVVSGTTLGHYTGNSISRDGGTSTISLGALTAPGGSQMYSLTIGEENLASTTTANVNGILPLGRVSVGSDFAAKDGSGNIVAYTGYTTATTAGGGLNSVVYQLTGGGTMANTLTAYALRIVNGGNSDVLDLSNKNLSLFNNSAFLYAGGFDHQYTINGSGALTSASGNQPFVINIHTGATLTLNARASANFAPVAKAGAGTLVFGGTNSTLGTMYVQAGVLRITNSAGLGNTGSGTIVQGGATLELSDNISIGAEALTLSGAGISNGGALRNVSGDNSYGGAITMGAGGARIHADGSTTLTLTGGVVTTAGQDVTFGGAGDITVSTAAITGDGHLIKDGAGIVTLSAANTYIGGTIINAGTLKLGDNDVLPDVSAVSIGAATLDADTYTDTADTLDVTGAGTINLGSGGALAFADSSAKAWSGGTLNITGTFVSGSSLRFGTDANGLTSAQLAVISVNGSGAGTYTLDSNGYLATSGGGSAPTASFTAAPVSGVEPLQVVLTDTSTGVPTSWFWDFNNDAAVDSMVQSPTNTFGAGTWTVSLVASNANGASSPYTTNINVITVQQSWEARYGVLANGVDTDGDGVSNWDEFQAGFNPTNNAAYPEILSLTRTGNDLTITYRASNGDTNYAGAAAVRTNVVDYSTGTANGGYSGSFAGLFTNVLSGGNGIGVITNAVEIGGGTNAPARYFRTRVLAP